MVVRYFCAHLPGLFLPEKSVVEACVKTIKIIYQSGKAPGQLIYEVKSSYIYIYIYITYSTVGRHLSDMGSSPIRQCIR